MDSPAVVTFLGSCSGTEPMPGRHHTSFTLHFRDRLYWFDAGECCSYTAHLAGLELPSTEAVFVSHTHMDHIGGLPNLLWTLRKLTTCTAEARQRLDGRTIGIYLPNLAVYEGMLAMLRGTEGGFRTGFSLQPHQLVDGVAYDAHGVRVRALHNFHLGKAEPFQSFSLRVEAGQHAIAYSGDVKNIADFAEFHDGCDLLLMETGHHRVEDVCSYLRDSDARFGKLVFVHHGRAILDDPERELAKARAILGNKVAIADDGMVLTLA